MRHITSDRKNSKILKVNPHRAKANAKAKKIKEQLEKITRMSSKTSNNIFAFAFARCGAIGEAWRHRPDLLSVL